jgi:hypothetical protein
LAKNTNKGGPIMTERDYTKIDSVEKIFHTLQENSQLKFQLAEIVKLIGQFPKESVTVCSHCHKTTKHEGANGNQQVWLATLKRIAEMKIPLTKISASVPTKESL